jgi:hypothetical protein
LTIRATGGGSPGGAGGKAPRHQDTAASTRQGATPINENTPRPFGDVARLNVHAALVGLNSSREADRILSQWLRAHGQGREIFDSPEEGRDPAGVDDEDRLEAATLETNSAGDAA